MPELPELEVVKEVLQRRVKGQAVDAVRVILPGGAIVVRDEHHRISAVHMLGEEHIET